jgi:hypothetical protein
VTSIATLTDSTVREVDRDAQHDGVDRRIARAVFWLPAVGAVVVAATLLHRPLFTALVAEDGPLEWTQFTLFLLASVLLAVAAWRLARSGDLIGCALIAVGALGIFGIAGEEISWGQRVFDWQTPSDLAAVNHQHETNIHNITAFPVQRIGNYVQLVLGAAGLVLPWLTRTSRPRVHVPVLRLLSPPLFVTSCFGLLFAYRAVRFLWASSVQISPVVTFGEWPELTFALGLSLFAALLLRQLRRTPAGRGAGAGTGRGPGMLDDQPPAQPSLR